MTGRWRVGSGGAGRDGAGGRRPRPVVTVAWRRRVARAHLGAPAVSFGWGRSGGLARNWSPRRIPRHTPPAAPGVAAPRLRARAPRPARRPPRSRRPVRPPRPARSRRPARHGPVTRPSQNPPTSAHQPSGPATAPATAAGLRRARDGRRPSDQGC